MVGQASISFGSGCCNAPSKSDEEPPVPDSSKVREIRHGLHIPLLTVATKSLASHTYSFEGLQILALVTSRLPLLSEQGDERVKNRAIASNLPQLERAGDRCCPTPP